MMHLSAIPNLWVVCWQKLVMVLNMKIRVYCSSTLQWITVVCTSRYKMHHFLEGHTEKLHCIFSYAIYTIYLSLLISAKLFFSSQLVPSYILSIFTIFSCSTQKLSASTVINNAFIPKFWCEKRHASFSSTRVS